MSHLSFPYQPDGSCKGVVLCVNKSNGTHVMVAPNSDFKNHAHQVYCLVEKNEVICGEWVDLDELQEVQEPEAKKVVTFFNTTHVCPRDPFRHSDFY